MAGGKVFLLTEYPVKEGDKDKSADGRTLEYVIEAWKQLNNIQHILSRVGYQVEREEKAIFNLHPSAPAEQTDDFKRLGGDPYLASKFIADELDNRDKVALFAVIWHNDSNVQPIYIKVEDWGVAGQLGRHIQVQLKLVAA